MKIGRMEPVQLFLKTCQSHRLIAMKFISVAVLLSILIVGTLAAYYVGDLVLSGEGWAYVLDTFSLFFAASIAGLFLVFTYSSIGLALSSISRGKFFPAISLLGIILGTKFIHF